MPTITRQLKILMLISNSIDNHATPCTGSLAIPITRKLRLPQVHTLKRGTSTFCSERSRNLLRYAQFSPNSFSHAQQLLWAASRLWRRTTLCFNHKFANWEICGFASQWDHATPVFRKPILEAKNKSCGNSEKNGACWYSLLGAHTPFCCEATYCVLA